MAIRWREMRPADVSACARMVAAHPIIGARYGGTHRILEAAWSRLLDCEARSAMLFEAEAEGARAQICAVGVSLFVDDAFLQELKSAPLVWIGPELARRMAGDDLHTLSGSRLRDLNSRGGLNLLVWEGCIRPDFETNGEARRAMITAFIEEHRGFLWKEVIGSQAQGGATLEWMIRSGSLLWDPAAARYKDLSGLDPEEVVQTPFVVGVTRTIELARNQSEAGSWIGALFDYRPPRIGFGRAEQRLLLAALATEGTDEELAEALGVAVPTVKKMWLSIYRRAAAARPQIFPDETTAEALARARGREKKRRLLAYVREHPEELRPHSRAVLSHR